MRFCGKLKSRATILIVAYAGFVHTLLLLLLRNANI